MWVLQQFGPDQPPREDTVNSQRHAPLVAFDRRAVTVEAEIQRVGHIVAWLAGDCGYSENAGVLTRLP